MIFVTVGSTFFDELLQAVDSLAADNGLDGEVVCQIGSSTYLPQHCTYFRWTDDFDSYLERCSLLITHGGMTVMEALWRNKPMIAVPNKGMTGLDQAPYVQKLHQLFGIVWTNEPSDLKDLIPQAKARNYDFKAPHVGTYISQLIQ